jgi:uncharacterized protein YbjT (DUF2867 family)
MSDKTYAVMGASGHIGRVVAERLLEDGHEVRAIGRSPENLKPLAAKGAKVHATPFDDAQALTQAFAGCDGVFAMIPPDMMGPDYRASQDRVGDATVRALSQSKAAHAVNLSSVGAHLPAKTGVILGLHVQEERLNALPDLNVVHLRPVSFMENLLWQIGTIKTQGILGGALRPDLKIPMIATVDIAGRAASLLLDLDFSGKSAQELLGERDLSMSEAASILGQAVGKPDLKYEQFPYEGLEEAMKRMGFPEKTVHLMIEMYRGFNDGLIVPSEPRSKRNTTPTAIEEFAKTVFAPAFLKETL